MLVKRHRGATAQSATPRTTLDTARAEARPMPRSPSMSPAFKSSADSSREQRLQSLIEKLKTQRTGASSSSEDEPRSNPRLASKTRGRNRRLVAARGDRKTRLNTLMELVKDAQAIYDHSKSTRAKKQLDAAKAKLKEFEADLRADQKSIDQMEKLLKDVSMRANPRRRKSSAAKTSARKTSARKTSARKTSARKTSARKPAAKTAARKPAARKPAARKSAARKSSARRVHSLGRRRSLGELDLVSGLGMLPHIAAMGMSPAPAALPADDTRPNPRRRRKSRKASSATAARRKSARPAAAKKTTRRKARRNAAPAISAIGNISALGRVSGSKRKSRKTGLPREVLRAIRSYSPHDLYVVRGGKTHHIEAKKSSSEYRDGKSHGLSGRFKSLYSKKNDHRVLHVNSVRLAFNTNRPATIDEIQKALNAWAGAFDGHHLNKHAAKTSRRANPPSIRAVGNLPAVRAIGTSHRHNPSAFGMFTGAMGAVPQVSMGQKIALGSASFVASLAVTNALSGLGRKMFEVGENASTGKKVGVDVGAHVVSAALPVLYLYKSSNTLKDADGERHTAMAYGWLAGVAGTAVARLAAPATFAKIPLIGGLLRVTNVNEDADKLFATGNATGKLSGVGAASMQKRLPDGRKITFLQQSVGSVGAINSLTRRRPVRRRGKSMSTGSYFKTGVGRYVPDTYDVVDYDDYVAPKAALSEFILDRSLDGFGATRRKKISARKATGMYVPSDRDETVIPGAGQPFSAGTANPLLRQPELVTGGGFGYDPNRGGNLIDEIKGIDTLDENELREEGFDNAPPEATSFIRALPDYARQIAQQNLGLIVGPSKIIEGATIVQLFTDVVQAVNRTQIGGQADMPKGASFPRRAGVFSNSIFSSVLPSVDNGYAFMDGNIKL